MRLVITMTALCLAMQGDVSAQVPDPELLRSAHSIALGEYGASVTIEGDWLAIASREFIPGVGTGHVALYHKDPNGEWQRDRLLRPSYFAPSAGWRVYDIQLRNGRLIAVGSGITVWGLTQTGWVEEGFFGLPDQYALSGAAYDYVSTDGETLLASIWGVSDAPVFFWERQGPNNWVKVHTALASQFHGAVPGVNNPTSFGSGLHVNGDVAVIGQCAFGNHQRGRAHVFRRTQGTWTFEQTLNAPGPLHLNQAHGYTSTGEGDLLFVSSAGGCISDPDDFIGSVFEYRYTPSTGWQITSQIRPTAEPSQLVTHSGFGAALRYIEPTLVVGAIGMRGPVTPTGTNTTGRGTILAFDRCGDLWNQRTVMRTPLAWGVWGIGDQRRMDYDGQSVVASNPNVGYPHPTFGYWLTRAGVAAVTPLAPLPPGSPCLEIGESFCSPMMSATPCACGTATEPGRGCPNSTGRGARLYCQGAFDQFQIDRAIVEDLPPGAPTLLLVGGPTPQPLPALSAGSGLTCVGQVYVRRLAFADSSGQARFDATPAPPYMVLYAALVEPFPLQAFYRDAQDPCGTGWNTSNGVLFTGGV